jgi:hypothetical protein
MFDPDHAVTAVNSFDNSKLTIGIYNKRAFHNCKPIYIYLYIYQENTILQTLGEPGISVHEPSRKDEPSASLYCN